jgi:maltose O-acetyltransferase
MFDKIKLVLQEEFGLFHLRLFLARLFCAPLPPYVGGRIRASILRLVGFKIGTGNTFQGMPVITGGGNIYSRFTTGKRCMLNVGCFLELGGTITIGSNVAVGYQCLLLTTDHAIGDRQYRAGPLTPKSIIIEDGAWLGARVTVLPGITIGAGSIVAAGALVTKDVPPNSMAAGVPAKFVRYLNNCDRKKEIDQSNRIIEPELEKI